MYESMVVVFRTDEEGIKQAAQFMSEVVRQGVVFRTETTACYIKVYFTGGF